MHIPENWGFLVFNDDQENSELSLKTDIELEQTLYAIFRKIKFGDYKYLMDSKEGTIINFNPEKNKKKQFIILQKLIKALILIHILKLEF